jgi:hypothetical protein
MNRTFPRILALLLALTFVLAACSRTDDDDVSTPSHSPSPGVLTVTPAPTPRPEWFSPFHTDELYTVLVHVHQTALSAWAKDGFCLEYTTEMAQRAGFPLEFKERRWLGGPTYYREFESYLRTLDRTIVITHSEVILSFTDGFLEEKYSDVWNRSQGQAELYLAFNQSRHGLDGVYAIPVDVNLQPRGLSVLVKNEVYHEYGREIRSAGDYEQLLRWIQTQDWFDTAPGLSAPLGTAVADSNNLGGLWINNMIRGIVAFNLFLPDMGYTLIPEWQTHMPVNWRYHTWLTPYGEIVEWYETGSTAAALSRFIEWQQDGLMDVSRGWIEPGLDKYPTLLVHTSEIPDMLSRIDMTQYTVNTLTQSRMSTVNVEYAAVARMGTDMGAVAGRPGQLLCVPVRRGGRPFRA